MAARDLRQELLDDVVALLEPGTKSVEMLAVWLKRPIDTIISALLELQAAGCVQSDGGPSHRAGETRWRLVPAQPVVTVHVCRPTRQASPLPRVAEDPAWWVGRPRDGFTAVARSEMDSRQVRK